jgi:amidase
LNHPIIFQSAHELAQAIASRSISAEEVLEAHLQHIATHNSRLNSIATLNAETARKQAKECDKAVENGEKLGPLHGVPMTIKDVFETEGLKTTCSFKPLANHVPKKDATVGARLKAAGAIVMGKTNVPMLAGDVQCNSPLFGRTNNPWNDGCTPGGTTSGGAAAIASGMSPLEFGSDIAGSVRLPAHYCGIFSMKPTEHAVSMAGHIPEPPGAIRAVRRMAVAGPLARSIQDLRIAFEAVRGPDGRDMEVVPLPQAAFDLKSLADCRIATTKDLGLPISGDTARAIDNATNQLKKAGCVVETVSPSGFDFDVARRTHGQIAGTEISVSLPLIARQISRIVIPLKFGADPIVSAFRRGARLRMKDYAKALEVRDHLKAIMDQFLSGWDAWLCPVAAGPAFTHRRSGKPIDIDGEKLSYWTATIGHTSMFNLTGHPVVVIPLGLSDEGLPIGAQLVGHRWRDLELLAIAQAVADCCALCQHPPDFI